MRSFLSSRRGRLVIAGLLILFVGVFTVSLQGGGSDEDALGPGLVIQVEPEESTTTAPTTTAVTTTTVAPVETTTTTTVRPPAENETFVAEILPSVDRIHPLTEPGGDEYVELEFIVANPTYFGSPLTLMVTDRTPDGEWLKVQIPVRPNGTEGWIPADQAEVTSHFVRAQVDVTNRTVQVWDGDELIAETGAVVGTARTPTPLGRFFVNDLVEKFPTSAYGPWILSLSAFSEALETFGGGVPVIAIHGTNRPELIGGAHSNGCIRIPNDVISFLAENVPIGTPVEIVA